LWFLASALLSAAGAAIPLFNYRDLVAATDSGVQGVSARYTPRSLRSGGITAAYAVSVLLERIMRLKNHASASVVMRHYLDPLVPPTPAARVSSAVRSLIMLSILLTLV
jgi:hypothetical protein